MKLRIAVAGSGKLGRDVGMFFLAQGHEVAWLSRDPDRLAALEAWVRGQVRRATARDDRGAALEAGMDRAGFFPVGGLGPLRADVLLECINESAADKRALFRALEGVVPEEAVRATSSSSILPDELGHGCAGLHFFYPVEVTGLVEAIFPPAFPEARRHLLLELLAASRLACIEQGVDDAFAVNRVLLPLQAEVLRLVLAGWPPRTVDQVSRSALVPVGQLALLDSIGLDVVHPAVAAFTARMAPEVAALYAPLRDGLGHLLALGKRGRKNRDGLLLGSPLPWSRGVPEGEGPEGLADRLACLFVNSCLHATEQGLLSEAELCLALESLFGWKRGLLDALEPLGAAGARAVLEAAHAETGRAYFVPAGALGAGDAPLPWPALPRLV